MFKRIARWFRRKRAVVNPFRQLLEAMDKKDHDLRVKIGPMSPSKAIKRWREVYPEDLQGIDGSSDIRVAARPSNIKSHG